jgi:hypothetical protein
VALLLVVALCCYCASSRVLKIRLGHPKELLVFLHFLVTFSVLSSASAPRKYGTHTHDALGDDVYLKLTNMQSSGAATMTPALSC